MPLVRTPTITFTDLNAPLRGHLARTQDPTEMMVVWNSRNNDDNPQVRWGTTAGGPYPNTAFAESTTYFQDDLCGPPATTQGWFPPHYWNYARINGLVPGSDGIVFYQYGSPSNGWSDEASFKPVPAPGPSQPVHIVTCADMGMTEYECQPGEHHHRHVRRHGHDAAYSFIEHQVIASHLTSDVPLPPPSNLRQCQCRLPYAVPPEPLGRARCVPHHAAHAG